MRYAPPGPYLIAGSDFHHAFSALAAQAHRSILIAQYQFHVPQNPSPGIRAILSALIAASARGVGITILLNDPIRRRMRGPTHGALIPTLRNPHISIRYAPTTSIMHSKIAIADESILLIGSHNISASSLYHSTNLSVLIYNSTLAQAASTYLGDLVQRGSNA